jgi:uncharacterized protein with HEPN domain
MREDRAFLEDILTAIDRIGKYTSNGPDAFERDELVQTWVLYHIQMIGEAVGKLSDELKAQHPEVPWAAIKAMRNVLVHFYFGVQLRKVWKTVIDDLPILKTNIAAILNELGPEQP